MKLLLFVSFMGLQVTSFAAPPNADKTAPKITITQSMPTHSPEVNKIIRYSIKDESTFKTYCTLDGNPLACSNDSAYFGVSEEGSHVFEIWAIDAAGNKSQRRYVEWVSDWTLPDIMMPTTPNEMQRSPVARFEFEAADISPVVFYCKLNDHFESLCQSPLIYRGLQPGTYSFEVYAKDAAGNISPTLHYQWTVAP